MQLILRDDTWALVFIVGSILLYRFLSETKSSSFQITFTISSFRLPSWSRTRQRWSSLWNGKKHLQVAHAKVLQTGKPCLLPGFFGDTIVLPPSLIGWLSKQPMSSFSSTRAQLDFFSTKITMNNAFIGHAPVHERVLRRGLNSRLEILPSVVIEEISAAFSDIWGNNSQRVDVVDLNNTIMEIVARAANRIFVGEELARNKHYIKNCMSYVNDVGISAMALNAVPSFMKSLVAPLFVLPNRIHQNRALGHLIPYFTKALAQYSADCHSLPDNYATWTIEHVMKNLKDERERDPEMLGRRIMAMNFAAVHTSTMVVNSFLLDILSDTSGKAMQDLRMESEDSTRTFRHIWCRTRLLKLHRLDSALRESMRLSGFLQRTLLRKVVAPEGAHLPDGTYIPKDSLVCFSGHNIHHDSSTYSNPFSYRHDRFLPADYDVTGEVETNDQEPPISSSSSDASLSGSEGSRTPKRNLLKTAVESDSSHMVWGLGKHACPGRFFAVDLIKMVTLYAISHYDIELEGSRPNLGWMEFHEIPPVGAKLRIRRRAASGLDDC